MYTYEPDTLRLLKIVARIRGKSYGLAAVQFLVFKDVGESCSKRVDITNVLKLRVTAHIGNLIGRSGLVPEWRDVGEHAEGSDHERVITPVLLVGRAPVRRQTIEAARGIGWIESKRLQSLRVESAVSGAFEIKLVVGEDIDASACDAALEGAFDHCAGGRSRSERVRSSDKGK